MPLTKQYHIYLSSGEKRFTETKHQPREYAGFVHADTLEKAFAAAQNNDGGCWNQWSPCRSVSVGDVIQGDEGFFLVKGKGFEKL